MKLVRSDWLQSGRADCYPSPHGHDNGNGYTRVVIDGRKCYAHRVSYEVNRGLIPANLVLDHLCRNRWCANPDHLEPVSNEENILRGESPPAANARKGECPRGHAYLIRQSGDRRCQACHQEGRNDTKRKGIGRSAERTHCPQGHSYDERNTYLVLRPDGSIKQRMCRECSRQRVRARRALRKEGEANARG